jgi:hypothetical protein
MIITYYDRILIITLLDNTASIIDLTLIKQNYDMVKIQEDMQYGFLLVSIVNYLLVISIYWCCIIASYL